MSSEAHRLRIRLLLRAMTLLGALACGAEGAAEDLAPAPTLDSEGGDSSPRRRILRDEITTELRLAVDRGFNYLIRNERQSGSYADRFPVAINALVGLAFLSGGYTNKEGQYTVPVQKVIDHLLQKQSATGYFDDGESRMYGHGFATLFLAELYGMTGQREKEIRDALKKAIRVIEKSQSDDGGWDYYPASYFGAFGASPGVSDTSITVCQTMALRAARNLGIAVDADVVKRAKDFIKKAQNSDGGFAYRLRGRSSMDNRESKFPRSAAGVCILLSLGDYDSQPLMDGLEYLMSNYRDFNTFPFYADYYCTQAMFQAGKRYWAEYFPYVREKLLRNQRPDGSWSGGMGGPGQSTAMALIVLQFPYRFLPISER